MDKSQLILAAQRKGFTVEPNDDGTGWVVNVPKRRRYPANTQGEFATPDRAWMLAAMLAKDW